MKKNLFCLSLGLFLFLGGCGSNANISDSYIDISADFALRPPQDWVVKQNENLKLKTIVGPAKDGFAPNINFIEDDNKVNAKVSLDQYVDASIKDLQDKSSAFDFKLLKRKTFDTDYGLKGEHVAVRTRRNNIFLRQNFYFFSLQDGKKIITVCSALDSNGKKYDSALDKSAKTFKVLVK